MALWHALRLAWWSQRGYLFPWVPVWLACGIGLYFGLKTEPQIFSYVIAVGLCLTCLFAIWLGGRAAAPVFWVLFLILLGALIAGARAHQLAEPVLGWRYYGPIEGRIVAMDRSASDALRLTLDRVVLRDTSQKRTPERVRISLHSMAAEFDPKPGLTIATTGHLSPPSGPVEPGGFDFQRHAWFLELGAVGYTRNPVIILAPAERGQLLFKARVALADRVRAVLPGENGAFAAAIMTGDRSAIGQETLQSLRVSNLAHLLAISGLHMGLLTGFVFAALRYGFALIPWLALRFPVKKLAAVGAMIAAAGYLALSGGSVATERAFIMVTVMLLAVLANRRALSLRAVALAATVILLLRPEALLGPGFQMSFAATTALVAAFAGLRDGEIRLGPTWMRGVATLVISSTVAGLATAPIAAAHFNQIAHYGLVANLLSVPLMGVLVMPMAVLSACLLPLGLDWIALHIMQLGLSWILGVAHWVSALDGARGTVMSPDPHILPMIALGALFLVLWQGRLRFLGVVPVILAFMIWGQAERPYILISDNGALVGVMTDQGRALSAAKGAGFVASNWLENDGDAADQAGAFNRWEDVVAPIRAHKGKRAAAKVIGCEADEWLVFSVAPDREFPCHVIHPGTLRETGALALFKDGDKLRALSARDVTGARLWNTQ
ncbi:MAG: ComEC/Rec2 family competence protein [Pseudomonadota bacterium]